MPTNEDVTLAEEYITNMINKGLPLEVLDYNGRPLKLQPINHAPSPRLFGESGMPPGHGRHVILEPGDATRYELCITNITSQEYSGADRAFAVARISGGQPMGLMVVYQDMSGEEWARRIATLCGTKNDWTQMFIAYWLAVFVRESWGTL